MATHASVLAWRIPGTGEPSGCRLWGHTESDTTEATEQQQPDICPGVGLLDHTAILFLVCFFFLFKERLYRFPSCVWSVTQSFPTLCDPTD